MRFAIEIPLNVQTLFCYLPTAPTSPHYTRESHTRADMSALGLFRSSTTRAIASIPSIAPKLAFPRSKTALSDSATILQHYKGRIQNVRSDSTLDDSHKHRITVRFVAELDLGTALLKAEGFTKRISEVFERAKRSKGRSQQRGHELVRKMELEECALRKQIREYRRQACKLYLYAPLGDATFSARRARLANYSIYIRGSITSSRASNRSRWPQAQESYGVVPGPSGFFF